MYEREMRKMRKTLAITCAASALIISVSHADVVETFELGTGDSTSSFVFQFTNGNQYMYEVSYDAPMTGQSVIEFIMDSQVDYFVADIVSYSFGDSLNGLAIGDDFDEGFGTPPDYLDYWHYWVKEDVSESWGFSSTGFGGREISDGSWDGWVFNSNDAPVPTGASLIALSCVGVMRRRRR
jgi:hypothetical protein